MKDAIGGIVPKRPSWKEWDYALENKQVPGHVVVIVNYKFKDANDLKQGNDCDKIHKLFSTYGYSVHCYFNKNKEQILQLVDHFSRKEDSGSLICFISSHGCQTSLACPKGEDVQIFDILKKADTKELDKCPKVFFFDACRSKKGSLDGKSLPEPPTQDYYVAFSCLDTKTSEVGEESCGVFIEEIIKVFEDGFPRPPVEVGKVRDLNHFMNKVQYAVTTRCSQVPTVKSTLNGKVLFQKHEYTNDVQSNTSSFPEQNSPLLKQRLF